MGCSSKLSRQATTRPAHLPLPPPPQAAERNRRARAPRRREARSAAGAYHYRPCGGGFGPLPAGPAGGLGRMPAGGTRRLRRWRPPPRRARAGPALRGGPAARRGRRALVDSLCFWRAPHGLTVPLRAGWLGNWGQCIPMLSSHNTGGSATARCLTKKNPNKTQTPQQSICGGGPDFTSPCRM